MYIKQTDSTNRLLNECLPQEDGYFIVTDYQTAGRGQVGNHWESKKGQNLLVSILIRPQGLAVDKQFRLSMIAALSVIKTLETLYPKYEWLIKWPNDIYYKEKKVGGILIENKLNGGYVGDCIFGLGLNINQTEFNSDAPNPMSIKQITSQQADRETILSGVISHLNDLKVWLSDARYSELKQQYVSRLFRREGYYPYADEHGLFNAKFTDIDEMGQFVLETEIGEKRSYLFKQIKFILQTI